MDVRVSWVWRCTLLSAVIVQAAGPQGIAAEPGSRGSTEDAMAVVTQWLQSLTFDGFDHREAIVQRVSSARPDLVAALVTHAQDEGSPLRLRARYMLRRAFWTLAPAILEEADRAGGAQRDHLLETFADMVDLVPVEGNHHGGWTKCGLVYERLGRFDLALEAYQRCEPPGDPWFAAEIVERLARCYRKLNQPDRGAELCWKELRREWPSAPLEPFAIALVDCYEDQGRLDELAGELDRLDRGASLATEHGIQVARDYLAIRKLFLKRQYDSLVEHLDGGTFAHFKPDEYREHTWRPQVVAEGFGRIGQQAVPVLAKHLQKLNDGYAARTVYALQLTQSPKAVEPVIREAARMGRLGHPRVIEAVRTFPEEATRAVIPWLGDADNGRHGAVVMLGELGTSEAVDALIEHFDGREYARRSGGWYEDRVRTAYAEHCLWALWRLTGHTLGMEHWPPERLRGEGKARWEAWWAGNRDGVEIRPLGWWTSPEAAPLLVEAIDSPLHYLRKSALDDLIALEHPVLARFLKPSVEARPKQGAGNRGWGQWPVVEAWLRFDPAACVPILIEKTGKPGYQADRELRRLTKQDFGHDQAAWRAWWEAHHDDVELPVEDRWW